MNNKKVFFHPKYQNPLAFFSGACENENMPIPCSATLGVICFQIITNACKYKIVFQLLVFPFKMQTLYVLPKLYRVPLFSINIYILVWNTVFWHFWWFSRALSAPDIFVTTRLDIWNTVFHITITLPIKPFKEQIWEMFHFDVKGLIFTLWLHIFEVLSGPSPAEQDSECWLSKHCEAQMWD